MISLLQMMQNEIVPTHLATLTGSPHKARVSLWHRYWLNHFLMHWVFLLHRHQIHLCLSPQHTAVELSPTGKIKGFEINLSYTPVYKIAKNADYLTAYQQLKSFLSPVCRTLSEYCRLNEAVFWHNAGNVIEFSLKLLESENLDVSSVYQQLFIQKKWTEYEYSPFYNSVEYVDFPELPFPQPVRLRKVCCHNFLDNQEDYCANCPKLKKLPQAELDLLVEKWRL